MIRLGMIGCGSMGQNHLKDLGQETGRYRFTALVDTDPAKKQKGQAHAPDAVQAERYADVTDAVDAVIVALPHHLHYPVARHFLEAGKHVLLEKPLALTERECLDLIELDRSPDPMLMVGYIMRYDPLWQHLGELIRTKAYGEVFQVSIWTEQYTDLARGEWLGKAETLGGGQLFSHGCHYIDLMLHWMGEPVEGTHIGTNLGTPWMEKEGTSNVTMRFANGALGYHFGTWGARGSRLKYAVHAHCTEGMLELDHRAGILRLHRHPDGGDPHALKQHPGQGKRAGASEGPLESVLYERPAGGAKASREQVLAFLDSIERQVPPPTPAWQSLHSLRVIWKLYEAEQQGRVADLRGLGFEQQPAALTGSRAARW